MKKIQNQQESSSRSVANEYLIPGLENQFEDNRSELSNHQALQKVMKSETDTTQLKTTIKHSTGTFQGPYKNFTVGTKMEAMLDPSDPVIGSETPVKSDMSDYARRFNPTLHQMHLLNADLGGFGVPENLYPGTAKANQDHYNNVERHVKKGLKDAHGNAKHGVYYTVMVKGGHDDASLKSKGTSFSCKAFYIDDIDKPNFAKYPAIADTHIISKPQSVNPTPNNLRNSWQGSRGELGSWNHKSLQGIKTNKTQNLPFNPTIGRRGAAGANEPYSLYTHGKALANYLASKKVVIKNDTYRLPSQIYLLKTAITEEKKNLERTLKDFSMFSENWDWIDSSVAELGSGLEAKITAAWSDGKTLDWGVLLQREIRGILNDARDYQQEYINEKLADQQMDRLNNHDEPSDDEL